MTLPFRGILRADFPEEGHQILRMKLSAIEFVSSQIHGRCRLKFTQTYHARDRLMIVLANVQLGCSNTSICSLSYFITGTL